MQRFYATGRQRIVLGLGSLLVVCLLTLGNFWLSSSATAGDEKPVPDTKKDEGNKKPAKVEPPSKGDSLLGLPPAGGVGIAEERSVAIPGLPPATPTPPVETGLPKTPPPIPGLPVSSPTGPLDFGFPKPAPASGVVTPEPSGVTKPVETKPASGESLVPPVAGTPPTPAPFVPTTPIPSDKPPVYSVPTTPNAGSGSTATPPPVPTPSPTTSSPSENGDIKLLMAQLNEIRAERGRLYEREKQTVEQIKKRFLEQRKALQQIEREMRALGVTPEEMAEDATAPPTPPVRPVSH